MANNGRSPYTFPPQQSPSHANLQRGQQNNDAAGSHPAHSGQSWRRAIEQAPQRAVWRSDLPVARRAAPISHAAPPHPARPSSAISAQTSRSDRTQLSTETHASFRTQLSRAPSTATGLLETIRSQTNQVSTSISSSRTSFETAGGPAHRTPQNLAQEIKNGTTENPRDLLKLIQRYTTPSKLVEPVLRPARFNNSPTMGNGGGNYHPGLPPYAGIPSKENAQLIHSGLGPRRDVPNPVWLSIAQQGQCVPTAEELLNDLPITELFRMVTPSNAGVIKITHIPYSTTRQEISSFLGTKAQIICQPEGSSYSAIHILMERETGKSLECFVEVASDDEAVYLAHAFKIGGHRNLKLGDRTVHVLYSSQDELLSELFPRAKHTRWEGGKPVVDMTPRAYCQDEKATGFDGFTNPEETAYVLRHARQKERSTFVARAPTRPYETLISIMHKYPWHTPKFILVHERDRIYDCVIKLMETLIEHFRARPRSRKRKFAHAVRDVSPATLQEVATTALVCPGFNDLQKARIVGLLELDGYGQMVDVSVINVDIGGLHELAWCWPFVALSVTPGADIELVKHYGRIFHDTTRPHPCTAADRLKCPMGDIKVKYNGKDNANGLTLAAAAEIEYAEIKELIKKGKSEEPDRDGNTYLNSREPTPTPFLNSRTATPTTASYNLARAIAAGPNNTHANDLTETLDRARKARGSNLAQAIANNALNDRDNKSTQPSPGAQNLGDDSTALAVAGSQNARGIGLAQITAGVQNNVNNNPAQPPTGAQHTRRNGLDQVIAGAQSTPSGYSLTQAMANAENRQRHGMPQVYDTPQNSANEYGSNVGGDNRASIGGPAYHWPSNFSAPPHGWHNSAFPAPSSSQGNGRQPFPGSYSSAFTGPQANQANQSIAHGSHSSASPTRFASQGNGHQSLRGSHSSVFPGPDPNQSFAHGSYRSVFPASSASQGTGRQPLHGHHSSVLPGSPAHQGIAHGFCGGALPGPPANQGVAHGSHSGDVPGPPANQGLPRPSPHGRSYFPPGGNNETTGNTVRSNFPW